MTEQDWLDDLPDDERDWMHEEYQLPTNVWKERYTGGKKNEEMEIGF